MKIGVGICGSIAAYRSPDLVKELVALGHQVRVALTASAANLVSPKVLETFSANPVISNSIFGADHTGTDHIEYARWADAFVIYGATANFLAKLACGLTDDFLSLQLSATTAPIYLVPAMNPTMWESRANQENVTKLRAWGYRLVGPIEGKVACGETGVGHIAEISEILGRLAAKPTPLEQGRATAWSGRKILISAGPMRSALDPVRYLQNQSSGKMGLALAQELSRQSAHVTCLLGPVDATIRQQFVRVPGIQIFDFDTAAAYQEILDREFPKNSVFFSAAAVLDFEFNTAATKLERSQLSQLSTIPVDIRKVADQVARVAQIKKPDQRVVAFAAESGTESEIITRAHHKLLEKHCDAMLANPNWAGLGANSEQNLFWVISPEGLLQTLGPDTKAALAPKVLASLPKILWPLESTSWSVPKTESQARSPAVSSH